MTFPDKILLALYNGNQTASTIYNQIASMDSNGEDDVLLKNTFTLLENWVRILQKYYDTNFDQYGNVITPAYKGITATQAEILMVKMKEAQGNVVYPVTIFGLKVWQDDYFFNDSDIWID